MTKSTLDDGPCNRAMFVDDQVAHAFALDDACIEGAPYFGDEEHHPAPGHVNGLDHGAPCINAVLKVHKRSHCARQREVPELVAQVAATSRFESQRSPAAEETGKDTLVHRPHAFGVFRDRVDADPSI